MYFFSILDVTTNASNITPNTFLDYSQFKGLRLFLKENNNINQVLKLKNVFEDAIVDTVIIILSKDKVLYNLF